jgi:hypothetical protein
VQIPPEYVPPAPSQIAPVLAQAESVSAIAPSIEVIRILIAEVVDMRILLGAVLVAASESVPAGRALPRRLSAATARGPDPRLVALAAPLRLHPSPRARRGRHASILP